MKWFVQRLQEPSSQAGLGMVAAGGMALAHGDQSGLAMLLGGIFAFVTKENGTTQAPAK
jgi:hypothetical protein